MKATKGKRQKHIDKMIGPAMAEMGKPKPTLHLTGKEAKQLFGMKPGAKVTAQVSGVITNVGVQTWSKDKEPEASIEIHKTRIARGHGD